MQSSEMLRYGIKYWLSVADLALEGRWQGKGITTFYLDLTTDLLHLFVYVLFFGIVFTNYGMPLHLVRSLVLPACLPAWPPACLPACLPGRQPLSVRRPLSACLGAERGAPGASAPCEASRAPRALCVALSMNNFWAERAGWVHGQTKPFTDNHSQAYINVHAYT
jgi:hypothetical protein